MSKYAVIKVGSSQEKVSVGDEFSVSSSFNLENLVPVLVLSLIHIYEPTRPY